MVRVTISYDAVSVAYLSGSLTGGSQVVSQLGGSPKFSNLTTEDYGDSAVPAAMKKFGSSWNFRRKYLIKEMNDLAKAANNFVKDVSAADRESRDFLNQVKARARKGPVI